MGSRTPGVQKRREGLLTPDLEKPHWEFFYRIQLSTQGQRTSGLPLALGCSLGDKNCLQGPWE